jgi:hypothetical protein
MSTELKVFKKRLEIFSRIEFNIIIHAGKASILSRIVGNKVLEIESAIKQLELNSLKTKKPQQE